MNRVILAAIILARTSSTLSHVLATTKNANLTTSVSVENQTQNVSDIKSGDRKKDMKSFNLNNTGVYLEDVVFSLKLQNWTAEEQPCLNMTLFMLQNLRNFTLWAVWNWDAISSEPQGLLYGSKYHLGNFDECMNAPWYEQHPKLRSQYCLADIVLERTDNPVRKRIYDRYDPYQSALNLFEYRSEFRRPLNELTWGVCAPAVCKPKSVERLMGTLLAHSHLGTAGLRARISVNEPCQKSDEPLPFDGAFYSFVGLMGTLTIIVLLCTYLTYKKKDSNTDTLQDKVIKAFDINTNAANLLKVSDRSMDILYGLKFLSMCIIVSGHQYGIFNGGPISNGSTVDQSMLSIAGLILLHEDLIVDSFFMLSGFLVATFLTNAKKFPNLFILLLRRYVRLTVALAVVIFYIGAVFPYTGSGPLWQRAVAADPEVCRKNWWINLLMLSNYVDTENICLVISWYVPCDFHFFAITVFMYWIYTQYPRLGKTIAVIITIAAIITPGVINYVYKLPAIQLFTYDFISNPRGPVQFHLTYIKSHTRYPAYLIGFFAGCLYIRCTDGTFNKIPRKWSILGACLSIFTMGVVMFSGPTFLWRSYGVVESAVYAALNRPAWALCCAMLVICCLLGHVPFIKGFLSWYPWVPLSRLTYGLYLVHSVLIARNVYVTRNPQHYDHINLTTSCLGIICEGTFLAFIIWLVAEAPANNLLNLCFMPRRQNTEQENNTPRKDTNDRGTTNGGHLEDNLPTTVEIISSKI